MKSIYLDYAATTPLDSRVREAMEPYWIERFGNPSSGHRFGAEALDAVEKARRQVAGLLSAEPNSIVFTGSGTEADNAALIGTALALKEKGRHLITSAIEHSAVLRTVEFLVSQGFEADMLPVEPNGILDPGRLEKALRPDTILVSVMHANNEIGTIQPLAEIGRIVRSCGILLHTDAVQSFGHLPIDVDALGVDLLSLSAHKLYGPKGVGALFIRKDTPFVPLIHGGGHEKGRRSSTHNVPGIVGLGRAMEIARTEMDDENRRILALRDRLWDGIRERIGGVDLNGDPVKRLHNCLNCSFERVAGDALLMRLDMAGVAVSSGSACSSGSGKPSHVLTAIGLSPERSGGSLRLTLGRFTTAEEIDRAVDILESEVRALRSLAA
jgi:cysteine desulfurase